MVWQDLENAIMYVTGCFSMPRPKKVKQHAKCTSMHVIDALYHHPELLELTLTGGHDWYLDSLKNTINCNELRTAELASSSFRNGGHDTVWVGI